MTVNCFVILILLFYGFYYGQIGFLDEYDEFEILMMVVDVFDQIFCLVSENWRKE